MGILELFEYYSNGNMNRIITNLFQNVFNIHYILYTIQLIYYYYLFIRQTEIFKITIIS